MIVQRFAGHAGLDHAVEVLLVYGEDAVHARQIERHAAQRRIDVAFERGAGAEGDDRHARLGAKLHRFDHLLRGLGEQHRVRRLRRDPGQRVGVLLAECRAGREAIAEPCCEAREQGALGLSRGPLDSVCHECAHGGTVPPLRFTKSEALERSDDRLGADDIDHRREVNGCGGKHEAVPDGVLEGKPLPEMEHHAYRVEHAAKHE